jgi:hypothetical protein
VVVKKPTPGVLQVRRAPRYPSSKRIVISKSSLRIVCNDPAQKKEIIETPSPVIVNDVKQRPFMPTVKGKKKILHVVPWTFGDGDAENFIWSLCEKTYECFENHVITPRLFSSLKFDGQNAQVHVVARTLANLQSEIIDFINPDIVIRHGPCNSKEFTYANHFIKSCRSMIMIHDKRTIPSHDRGEWFLAQMKLFADVTVALETTRKPLCAV